MSLVTLAVGAAILLGAGGIAVRLATGEMYFSAAVSRRQKNLRHLVTLGLLLISLAMAWGLVRFDVVETGSGYAMAALIGGVLLLRAVFTKLGLRRWEAA